MTQELADSINELRNCAELGALVTAKHSAKIANQLVELVAEMRDTLEYGKRYSAQGFPALLTMPAIDTQREFNQKADNAYAKADALLSGLKENV
jgi:hypothetical protein